MRKWKLQANHLYVTYVLLTIPCPALVKGLECYTSNGKADLTFRLASAAIPDGWALWDMVLKLNFTAKECDTSDASGWQKMCVSKCYTNYLLSRSTNMLASCCARGRRRDLVIKDTDYG